MLVILACKIVSKVLKKNDIIVFESTVYPGTTNKICVPIIEKFSKARILKKMTFLSAIALKGYNLGDAQHVLKKINKIIAVPNLKIKKTVKKFTKIYQKN